MSNNGNQLQRACFNVVEVAYALNVSKAQVRKWISSGVLPVTKLPYVTEAGRIVGTINRTLVHCDDLAAFVAKYRTASPIREEHQSSATCRSAS